MLPSGVSKPEVALWTERVLKSSTFRNADRLRELLQFLIEQTLAGGSDSLKEVVIGVAVFHREPGYDPKSDNIVRTTARRLRARLDEYYRTEGVQDAIRIELQKGSYVPLFLSVNGAGNRTPPAVTPGHAKPPAPWRTFWPVIATLAAAVVIGLYFLARQPAQQTWHSVPFTSAQGYETFPAISPDGRKIAYAWDGGSRSGSPQIYVKAVGGQSPQQITKGPGPNTRPAWSRDGKRIAYLHPASDGRHSDVYIALSDGGRARRVASLASRDIWMCNTPRLDWSRNDTRLVTAEEGTLDTPCKVVAIDIASGKKRYLTNPPADSLGDVEPKFSPNGKQIAFLRMSAASIGDLYVMPSAGGRPRRITFDNLEIRGFDWSADGRALIYASRREGGFLNLWRIPIAGGTPAQLTNGPVDLGFPSVAKTGRFIAYVAYRDNINIWRFHAATNQPGTNQPWITSISADASPAYSPDGKKIAFISNRSGNLDVWMADADGQDPVRLTDFARFPAGSPAWSPDSKRLAFDLRINGRSRLYIVDAAPGHKPVHVNTGSLIAAVPNWSRDGRFLNFAGKGKGSDAWNLYRVSLAGGAPVQLTRSGGFRPLESPDGRFVYFTRNGRDWIWRIRLGGSGAEEPLLANFEGSDWENWAVGAAGLYFLRPDVADSRQAPYWIELLGWASKKPQRLGRTAKAPNGEGFSVSPDGSSALYAQYDQRGSDILLLER